MCHPRAGIYAQWDGSCFYRVIVEEISEAAATLSLDGTILFCNGRFSELVKAPPDHAIGASLAGFVGDPYQNR